ENAHVKAADQTRDLAAEQHLDRLAVLGAAHPQRNAVGQLGAGLLEAGPGEGLPDLVVLRHPYRLALVERRARRRLGGGGELERIRGHERPLPPALKEYGADGPLRLWWPEAGIQIGGRGQAEPRSPGACPL